MRILHGMSNVAGQGTFSVKGLKDIGLDAVLAIWRNNKFGYECDLALNIGRNKLLYPWYALKMFAFGVYAMFHFDVFHFHFGYSLFPYNLDLPLLKKMKKKFVMEFHGSDVRYQLYRERSSGWKDWKMPDRSGRRIKQLKKIFYYTDTVILHDEELRKHLVGYKGNIVYVPLRADISRFEPSYPLATCNKPIIVHAPTNREVKGSDYIIQAVECLKKKYDFEFILVENKTQNEAIEIYKKADIIIDQLRAGTYGVFAIESMALGKPVISYISEDMREHFPEELPIINATVDDITDKLEYLLKNGELRNHLGLKGREYVENYHDYRVIAWLLYDIYLGKYVGSTQKEAFQTVKKLKKANSLNLL